MAPFPLRALGQERAISEPPWDKDALGLNGANSGEDDGRLQGPPVELRAVLGVSVSNWY